MDGEYVRNKLKKGEIQLKDIAEALDISQQSLNSKLNSKDMKVSFLFALARAINKNVYYFFGDEFDNAGGGKIKPFTTEEEKTKSTGNVVEKNYHKNYHGKYPKPKVQKTSHFNNEEIEYSTTGKALKKVSNDGALVPYYDVDFAAGTDIATFNDDSVQPAYYMDVPEFSGCTAFRAYSDSMEKLIKSGNVLFGTKIETWHEHLEYGQIYGIICNDGRRYLKYIRRADNHTQHFLLRSENSNYDDFDMPKSAIRSIWLIHGWLNKRT